MVAPVQSHYLLLTITTTKRGKTFTLNDFKNQTPSVVCVKNQHKRNNINHSSKAYLLKSPMVFMIRCSLFFTHMKQPLKIDLHSRSTRHVGNILIFHASCSKEQEITSLFPGNMSTSHSRIENYFLYHLN